MFVFLWVCIDAISADASAGRYTLRVCLRECLLVCLRVGMVGQVGMIID